MSDKESASFCNNSVMMRNSHILDIFFKFILAWFALSHTTYILTLVDNIHIFPKFFIKANNNFRHKP